jgi:hypothetical protein
LGQIIKWFVKKLAAQSGTFLALNKAPILSIDSLIIARGWVAGGLLCGCGPVLLVYPIVLVYLNWFFTLSSYDMTPANFHVSLTDL